MSDEARQDYVVGLVQQINDVLNGEEGAEAATALTIAVACHIVSISTGSEERLANAHGFAKHLHGFVTRADIVEWIKAHTQYTPGGRA